MSHETPSSTTPLDGGQGLKSALRRVFDGQIPNYGDYNLIFAADPSADGTPTASSFVVGYRWRPAELMIAPVDLSGITGAGAPVEINMTNLAHALQWEGDGSYEVGTSTGRVFRFGVTPLPVLDIGPGALLTLVQDDDVVDFEAFMEAFIEMA